MYSLFGPTFLVEFVLIFQNKMGWKDDLKDLLTEIYSFNKIGVEQPDEIVMPKAFEGMVLHDFKNIFLKC